MFTSDDVKSRCRLSLYRSPTLSHISHFIAFTFADVKYLLDNEIRTIFTFANVEKTLYKACNNSNSIKKGGIKQ